MHPELLSLYSSLLHSCCSDLAASTAPAFVTVYLDLSQTPRAPIAPACCSDCCHYQCYSSCYFWNWSTSSLWSIADSQRWYYSSYLTQTQGWGSCCFWCWSTSISWFMSHPQCCYLQFLSWICYRLPALLQYQHPIYVSVHTSIASIERCNCFSICCSVIRRR